MQDGPEGFLSIPVGCSGAIRACVGGLTGGVGAVFRVVPFFAEAADGGGFVLLFEGEGVDWLVGGVGVTFCRFFVEIH